MVVKLISCIEMSKILKLKNEKKKIYKSEK